MKATELRIGNWVEIQGLESKIILVDTDGCICENEYCEDFENNNITQNLQPIPLTEEWLKRFGFEKKGNSWVIGFEDDEGKGFNLEVFIPSEREKQPSMWGIWIIDKEDDGNFLYAPKKQPTNVHQLQNLYFALTGEELNLNK